MLNNCGNAVMTVVAAVVVDGGASAMSIVVSGFGGLVIGITQCQETT